MKWKRSTTPGPRHAITTDGKWCLACVGEQFMLTRLGVKRGEVWEGSEIVAVGTQADCLAKLEELANEQD